MPTLKRFFIIPMHGKMSKKLCSFRYLLDLFINYSGKRLYQYNEDDFFYLSFDC